MQFIAKELQMVAVLHRIKAFFYCQVLYLGLTLILLISHDIMNTAEAQSSTPTCAPTQEDCSTCQRVGDLRLVGGDNFTEGRLEFCYNNLWGTVCDNGFGVEDAMVVCRQLGFSDQGALDFAFAMFGQGTGPIVLDRVNCIGNEARLIDCGHSGLGVHECDHNEDIGVRCMIQSIVTKVISISSTTQLQSITPTQTPLPTDSSTGSGTPTTSNTIFSTNEVDRSTSTSTSLITASPTSGTVLLTTISPSSSLLLTVSERTAMTTTSSLVTQSQSSGGGGRTSIAATPTDTGPLQSRDPSNVGLIVGLVFLFLILVIAAGIVIVLLVIIILRKKKEKKIKRNTRHWYVQENPVAQSTSFEGDSIFNLLEDTNGSLRPPTGHRDSAPDFLVVRHRLPFSLSTVPNAYNNSPGLEIKSVPVKKTDKLDKVHNDGVVSELSKSPPSGSLLSTIVDAQDVGVMYTDVTFKSGTPVGTRKVLYDVEEEESDDGSDWSQQSSFEDDEDEKPEAKGEKVTYSEVKFKNS